MITVRVGRAVAAGTIGLLAGCVDRRFVVDANVPGAQITVDGKPIGPSPADDWYTYPGAYEFRAVAPGYQPLTKVVRLKPKWYDYPGLDFFAEVLWPFRIEDVRHVRMELEPARPVRADELLDRANHLRDRSATLPPSQVPEELPGTGKAPRDLTPPPVVTPGPQLQQSASSPGPVAPPDGGAPYPIGPEPKPESRFPAPGSDPETLFPPPRPQPAAPGAGVVPNYGSFNR